MKITGKTFVYGIFGYPVKHSLSPLMQTAAFKAKGIDAVYVPFEVEPKNVKESVNGIKALNIKGVNVTVPLKEKVIPFLDEIDEYAEFIGAVNTIKNVDGKLYGFNTDGPGFIDSLKEENVTLKDKNVLIIGAGGSAKAISFALLKEGISSLLIANRSAEKGKFLADKLKSFGDVGYIPLSDIEKNLTDIDILINTTSVGMKEEDPHLFDYDKIPKNLVVVDIIYTPYHTKLLRAAKEKGAKVINGIGMLIHQGARAFKLWTDVSPPTEIMRKTLLEALGVK